MTRLIPTILCFIALMTFFSCKKISDLQHTGDPQFIQVLTHYVATYPGKIRSNAQNNLYCSYNYYGDNLTGGSAIIKLDVNGDTLWRRQFDFTIFDFRINDQGDLIVASAKDATVSLSKLTPMNELSDIGSDLLPTLPGKVTSNVLNMKILLNENNYILSGTMSILAGNLLAAGFLMEMNSSGTTDWKQAYFFSDTVLASTSITGCIKNDTGFLLFGNFNTSFHPTSSFFIMQCTVDGEMLWETSHTTSTYDASTDKYTGILCGTSDIISASDNNTDYFFVCVYNVLYNTPGQDILPVYTDSADDSVRIYKIYKDSILFDSLKFQFDVQNEVADFVLKDDGGLFIALNPNKLGNIAVVGQRNSFIANVSADLDLINVSYIQNEYTDFVGSVWKMDDGHYAIENMIQSLGKEHYNLEIIKTDENGNF